MPKISRVRIVNFEYNDGKRLIADEVYDFSNHKGDDALNVLINLANGGGKSVLVQLMMQPIIPKAKVAGRRIESFFTKQKDHCFVMLEWQKDHSTEKLLTGIAMTARGSAAEDDDARGLSVNYYTFYANYASDRSDYSIVNLPLSRREGSKFIPADYEAVRNIAKRSGNVLQYYLSDQNIAWKQKLEEYGLVQNEWHTMERLNSEEGGFGKFFGDFRSADQLIDNLLIKTIEGKLETGSTGDDHSLSTMLLAYARQYAQRKEELKNKETFEAFALGMQKLKPLAEELWNANDRREKNVQTLFGLLDTLTAKISQLQQEQSEHEEKLKQLQTKKHEIEHEQISAEYHHRSDAYDEVSQECAAVEAELQTLEADLREAILEKEIQECANYYGRRKNLENDIAALQEAINLRESGGESGAELNAKKYAAFCAIVATLDQVQPRLIECQEAFRRAQAESKEQEAVLQEAKQLAQDLLAESNKLEGSVNWVHNQIQTMVEELAMDLFPRIDGLYAEEDLDEIRMELNEIRREQEQSCASETEKLKAIDEELAEIPDKRSDLTIQHSQLNQQKQVAADALEAYLRPLVEFCVSDFRQTQEYHVINVHDGGLFPLSTAFPVG